MHFNSRDVGPDNTHSPSEALLETGKSLASKPYHLHYREPHLYTEQKARPRSSHKLASVLPAPAAELWTLVNV